MSERDERTRANIARIYRSGRIGLALPQLRMVGNCR